MLMSTAAADAEGQARLVAFVQGLQQLGWISDRNVRIDIRWPTSADEARKYAQETYRSGARCNPGHRVQRGVVAAGHPDHPDRIRGDLRVCPESLARIA
jgi:hypothetical protein